MELSANHHAPPQVVFDSHNSHRRKSSLVSAENPAHLYQRGKNTACYVHALLEAYRRSGRPPSDGLKSIAETFAEPKLAGLGTSAICDDAIEEDEISHENGLRTSEEYGKSPVDDGKKLEEQLEEEPPVHSRLLTKKQLSDMAWGVRELSKRLTSIRLKLKVKTVFLLTKAHDEAVIGNTREVARWLLRPEREVKYTVYVEENLRHNKKFNSQGLLEDLEKVYASHDEVNEEEGKKVSRRLKYWTDEMCRTKPHTFDFVVTLGGDGTVLYASWLFQRIVPPVLSFSLGSLGFLTKFDYENFQSTLTKAFVEGVTISLRLRFEGTVMRSQKRKKIAAADGTEAENEGEDEPRDLVEELVGEEKEDERTHRPDGSFEILNDIVVDRGPNPSTFLSPNI